jgi:bifunctional non-homologous end joining protein LigD
MSRAKPALLEAYAQKRDFSRTSEPAPGEPPGTAGQHRFVVHLHDARRRHFDLRLEIDGVLKCWAIPRGPSANPRSRRLAVRTEDHPLSYRAFEGLIPRGEYGAGPMLIWDRGTWFGSTEAEAKQALEDGHLKLQLDGERMRGAWALTRLSTSSGRENWILVKERDRYAEADDTLADRFHRSVGSDATLPALARGRKPRTRAVSETRLPPFVPPMLCHPSPRLPATPGWRFEMKYDGYRMQIAKAGREVALRSRKGNDWTARLPAIAAAARELPEDRLLLDGELVRFDDSGITDFDALVADLADGDDRALVLVAFDVLVVGDTDLASAPLEQRRRHLERLLAGLPESGALRLAPSFEGEPEALLAQIVAMGGEGLVAKREDAAYVSRRSKAWWKVKALHRTDVTIVGYVRSDKGLPLASLAVAEEREGDLRYAGRIGTGFSDAKARALSETLAPLERRSPAVAGLPERLDAALRQVTWVDPRVVATIGFNARTRDGQFRGGRLLGIRAVTGGRSRSSRIAKGRTGKGARSGGAEERRPVLLTNGERVLFPDDGLTKSDLFRHYERIAPRMWPHLERRLVSAVRAPDGLGGETFFQRHPMPAMRVGIERVQDKGSVQPYMAVASRDGVLTLAQFGAIEIHGWMARAGDLEHPDRLVLDLDPDEGLPFGEVRAAAGLVRSVLRSAGLVSFAMVTGGKGVHVVAPLAGRNGWSEVEAFTAGLARRLAALEPERFVATMSKRRRKGRIFVDWLRNKRSATAIVPYSVRARRGAPIAMPVSWAELDRLDRSDAYRLGGEALLVRDPWRGFFDRDQVISEAALRIVAG